MNEKIRSYFMFMLIFFTLDLVWIVGARKFHVGMIESVQKEPFKANIIAAFLFYIMAPLAYILIIEPHSTTLTETRKNAMTIGFLMYGTFDLTNKTIFKRYSWSYTILDTWWGVLNFVITTFILFKLKHKKH